MKTIVKNKKHLLAIIQEETYLNNNCDLNHLDVSGVIDMSQLFEYSNFKGNMLISQWNVSNVENMQRMFAEAKFNVDISNWDVSKVKNMKGMFCYSQLKCDLSNWDVSNVENMRHMFFKSSMMGDLSNWNTLKAEDIVNIFKWSDCVQPYWAEFIDIEERRQAVKNYNLKNRLNQTLNLHPSNQLSKIKL